MGERGTFVLITVPWRALGKLRMKWHADVQNWWSCNSTPPIHLHDTLRDNLVCTFHCRQLTVAMCNYRDTIHVCICSTSWMYSSNLLAGCFHGLTKQQPQAPVPCHNHWTRQQTLTTQQTCAEGLLPAGSTSVLLAREVGSDSRPPSWAMEDSSLAWRIKLTR
jgi:hypothetical protein